ncbi:type I glyceraldehyde-3-phosphate dehydrogenase [Candidatus Kuenenbacteria bacterium]|nr:type I glyceraldehyde-3-phosphate dehydrogenase [Candidatus Kuenenbacteria bacterium]
MIKVAINGFGRVGRATFKIALTKKNLKVVAINDLGDIENLAYLLQYDTAHGRFDKSVKVSGKNLVVGGKQFPFFSIADPAKLPWKKHQVDVALECTGAFRKTADVKKHLKAGAKNVILSAPIKDEGIATVVRGVNDKDTKKLNAVANASCTTNCVSPIMAVLDSAFGVEKAMLSTVHAVTSSQRTVDLADEKDWRRGRSILGNIIPTTTGAAIATGKVIPSLQGKFDGMSIRVPMITGSLIDVVALLKENVTEAQVNSAFKKYSKMAHFKGVLEVTEDELVSSDIIGTTASAIVDLKFTKVVDGNLVKIIAWYDNEWAYSHRLVEMAEKI